MAQNMFRSPWVWVGIIVVLAVFWLAGSYNGFVKLEQNIEGQWAKVETDYQRRLDLIPNLIESVKGLTEQERTVFGDLADARSTYAGSVTVSEKAAAAGQVESALARLLAIVENYPELRSSEAFQNLMVQLEGTENRISVERKRYNDTVREYNTTIKRFPANMIAGMFGFEETSYFEAVEGAETAPSVDFAN